MSDHKIVCHAPGDRCLGCDHYHGKAPKCEYADATPQPNDGGPAFPMNTEQPTRHLPELIEAAKNMYKRDGIGRLSFYSQHLVWPEDVLRDALACAEADRDKADARCSVVEVRMADCDECNRQLYTEISDEKRRREVAEAKLAYFVNPDTLPKSIDDATMREWDLSRQIAAERQRREKAERELVEANVTILEYLTALSSLWDWKRNSTESNISEMAAIDEAIEKARIHVAQKGQP